MSELEPGADLTGQPAEAVLYQQYIEAALSAEAAGQPEAAIFAYGQAVLANDPEAAPEDVVRFRVGTRLPRLVEVIGASEVLMPKLMGQSIQRIKVEEFRVTRGAPASRCMRLTMHYSLADVVVILANTDSGWTFEPEIDPHAQERYGDSAYKIDTIRRAMILAACNGEPVARQARDGRTWRERLRSKGAALASLARDDPREDTSGN